MSLIEQPDLSAPNLSADEALRHAGQRKGRLIRLLPPAHTEPALRAWAAQVAAAADRRVAELEARLAYLQDLAVTDELTGALNRRGFLVQFARAVDAARRGGPSGALIICDLDGFKAVNDRLGHGVGDAVLRQVAEVLMRGVRKMDVAARLGGDEFALLLIGAEPGAAQRRIAGFAAAIAALAPKLNGGSLPLSASFGFATFDGAADAESVLARADKDMYAQKRRGACSRRRHHLAAVG